VDSAQQIFAGLDAPTLAFALVVIFIAAAVRGYSGFGASALIVTSLTLVLPPTEVVPISLLLEIAASLGLLAQVWKDVPWRTMAWLLAGAALGMPAGFALLAALPADVMRVVISLLVLLACALIWRGAQASSQPGRPAILGTGVISGIANGTAAVGGLPVVLFFLYSAAAIATSRATLIVYLLIADIYGTGVAWMNGLVTQEVLQRTALFCIPLFLGVWLGNRHFLATSPDSFRRFTLILLVFLASAGLLRAALG
jgi:uncharacterized membrane protein YfcA